MRALLLLAFFAAAVVYAQTAAQCPSLNPREVNIKVNIGSTYDFMNCTVCRCICSRQISSSEICDSSYLTAQWACYYQANSATCPTSAPPTEVRCVDNSGAVHLAGGATWNPDQCTQCSCINSNGVGVIRCTQIQGCSTGPIIPKCYEMLPDNTGALVSTGFLVGTFYDSRCKRCWCRSLSTDVTTPPFWDCQPINQDSPNCATTPTVSGNTVAPPPVCTSAAFPGRVWQIGEPLLFPCRKCICVGYDNQGTPAASFQCAPIENYPNSATFNPDCPTTAAPVVRCQWNGAVYAVGATVPTQDPCVTCTCGADGRVTCVKTCTQPPPSVLNCTVGDSTILVGQTFPNPPCETCRCVRVCTQVAGTVNSISSCVAKVECIQTTFVAPCIPNPTDYKCTDRDGNGYPLGGVYNPDRCVTCTCRDNGWDCVKTFADGCTPPPPRPCFFNGQEYPVGYYVEFDSCTRCFCQGVTATTSQTSGVASSGWNCTKNGCPTTAPASTGAPTDQQFCYDKSGVAHLPGDVVPTRDGCSICTCGYIDSTGAATRTPVWNCKPNYGTPNIPSPCCEIDGVLYPSSTNIIFDYTNGKNCTCIRGQLTCRDAPALKKCTFNGESFAPGAVRKNPNGCGVCVCGDDGLWQCPEARLCPVSCATVQFTFVWTNPSAVFTKEQVALIIDSVFGANVAGAIKWEFVAFVSEPGRFSFTIVVRCINLNNVDRAAALAQLKAEFGASFNFGVTGSPSNTDSNGNNAGAAEPTVGASIVDPGTEATTTPTNSAASVAISFVMVTLFAVLAIFA